MPKTYQVCYRVLLDDLDFMGIVSHPKWLTLMERTRTEALKAPFKALLNEGLGVVIAEAHVQYKRPAKYDELLTFEISFPEIHKSHLLVHHHAKNEEGKTCVEGTLKLVFVSQKGRPTEISEAFRDEFLVS